MSAFCLSFIVGIWGGSLSMALTRLFDYFVPKVCYRAITFSWLLVLGLGTLTATLMFTPKEALPKDGR